MLFGCKRLSLLNSKRKITLFFVLICFNQNVFSAPQTQNISVNPQNTNLYKAAPIATPSGTSKADITEFTPEDLANFKKMLNETLTWKFSGNVMTDYAHYVSGRTPLGNGIILRRAFFAISGSVAPDWTYKWEIDVGRGNLKVRDAYLRYIGFHPLDITIGQFKEYFSLEELSSSNYTTFLERALPVNAFAPSYKLGIGANTFGDLPYQNSYTLAAGLFGTEVSHTVPAGKDKSRGVTGRATLTHMPAENKFFEMGLAGSYRVPDSTRNMIFSSKPESDVTSVTLVNTGTIANVTSQELYGLEASGVYGPFSAQGEYIKTHISRQAGDTPNPNLNFSGWYAYGSFFLTGESRGYDKERAAYTLVKPCNPYGAWEVALRYSYVNLTDDSIIGGAEHDITAGLNWYPNSNVRFMFNYIKALSNRAGVTNTPSIYTLRAQINW